MLNPTQQLGTLFGVLDSPIDKETMINTLNIQGWILVDIPDQSPNIEIRLDEIPIHTRIDRVPRPDVAAAYPGLAEINPTPGFVATVNVSPYTVGTHSLTCVAHNRTQSKVIGCVKIDIQSDLPYYSKFREFEKRGSILKRIDIYGTGLPSPMVSNEALSYVKKYAGQSILDVGCGIGAYIKALAQDGYECEGIEYNQNYVAECLKNSLKVKYMDARELAFPANSFDTVMMIEVLEHLPEPIIALKEAFRVARKNVLISVPNIDVIPIMSEYQVVPWHMLEATHQTFYTPKILESVLKQFTGKIEVFTYGHFAPWITEQPMHMHIFGVGYK